MRNLNRLTNAANREQARSDYRQLVKLAVDAEITEPIPLPPADAGWRVYDKAADVLIIYVLKSRPDLREVVKRIYPGFEG